MATFAELHCRRHNLPREHYARDVLSRCLYSHARFLAPLVAFVSPDHFDSDSDLVIGVGDLRRLDDLRHEFSAFAQHPENRGFLRRGLRLRISGARLHALVADTLPARNRP